MIITLLSVLCSFSFITSQTVNIYFNNEATNSIQNGTQDFPYIQFSNAAIANITELLATSSVNLLFTPTQRLYQIYINTEFTDVASSSVLTFSTIGSNFEEFACGDFAYLELSGQPSYITSTTLSLVFQNVNIYNQYNAEYSNMNIIATGPTAITFSNACLQYIQMLNFFFLIETKSTLTVTMDVVNLAVGYYLEIPVTNILGFVSVGEVDFQLSNLQLFAAAQTTAISILQVNVSAAAYANSNFTLNNAILTKDYSSKAVNYQAAAVFSFSNIGTIVIENFQATFFSSEQNIFFVQPNCQFFNATNISLINMECNACYLFGYLSYIPSQLFLTNIEFFGTVQTGLLMLNTQVESMTISNFSLIYARIVQSGLIYFGLATNNQQAVPLNFFDVNITGSQMGALVFINSNNSGAFGSQVPDYNIIINNFLLSQTNVTDGSPTISSFSIPVIVTNSTITGCIFMGGSFIQMTNTTGNVLVSNLTLSETLFQNAPFIELESFYEFPTSKYLCYRMLSIMNSVFNNIYLNSELGFISSGVPFFIFSNNIISGITGTQIFFLNLQQTTSIQNYVRNTVMEQQIFYMMPEVLTIFDAIQNTPFYCANPPCYFNFLSGNVFHEVDIIDSNMASFMLYMEVTNFNITFIISHNIMVDMVNNIQWYLFPLVNHFIFQTNDIVSNMTAGSYTYVGNAAVNYFFYQNTINKVNMPYIYFYSNLTTLPIGLLCTMVFNQSVFYQGNLTQSIISIQMMSVSQFDFSGNIFAGFNIQTTHYVPITVFDISVLDSKIKGKLNENIFLGINMNNEITVSGFYPPITNCFMNLQASPNTGYTLNNVVMNSINIGAKLSMFLNVQADDLNITNTTMNFINMTNTNGYGSVISTANFLLNNVTIINNTMKNFKGYVGDSGLFTLSFTNVYNDATINFMNLNQVLLRNWGSLTYFLTATGTFYNVSVTNSNFDHTDQVFEILSNGGNVYVENVTYTSDYGYFIITANQLDSEPSLIEIYNFTQKNSQQMQENAAFQIYWGNMAFKANGLILSNAALIKTAYFVGDVDIRNTLLLGSCILPIMHFNEVWLNSISLTNLTMYNFFANALLQVSVVSNNTLSINGLTIQNTQILTPIIFKSQIELALTSANFSNILLHNVSGQKGSSFINYYVEFGRDSNITMNDCIFLDMDMPVLNNLNANLFLSNIIHTGGQFVDEIVDKGKIPHQTQLYNVSIVNTYSSTNWMSVDGKLLDIDSMIIAGSVNGLKARNLAMSINNSAFYWNINPNGPGGCINSENSTLVLLNSFVKYNFAEFGGFIYENLTTQSGALEIDNSYVMDNYAYLYGPWRASQVWGINMNSTLLNPNSTSSIYYNMALVPNSTGYQYAEYNLYNASTAGALNNNFTITFTDYNSQHIFFSNMTPLSVSVSDPISGKNVLMSMDTPTPQNLYQFLASNITFPSYNSTMTVNITAQIQGMKPKIRLNIFTRECLPGENLDSETFICTLCPANYFSLNTSQECSICPTGANCPGGQFINVTVDYWREPNSASVYPCLSDGRRRCDGGMDPSNQCAPGYSGALCLGCNVSGGYTQSSGNVCVICEPGSWWLITKNILIVLATYLYEVFFIYLAFNSNKNFIESFIKKKNEAKQAEVREQYLQAVHIFLLTNFLQIVSLVATYVTYVETNLVAVLDQLQFFLMVSSSQIQQSSDFNCMMSYFNWDPNMITYYKVEFSIFFPIFKILFTCLVLIIKNLIWKVDQLARKISLVILSFLMLDQLGVLQTLSKLKTCFNGTFYGYSQMDPNLNCSDPEYTDFVDVYVNGNLIFWGIIVPGAFASILVIFRNRRKEFGIREILGGLMNNFEDRAFYWGLVIMLLKLGLLATFTLIQDPRNATTVAILILSGYLYLTQHIKPYSAETINNADKNAAFALFVTMIMFNQAIGNLYQDLTYTYAVLIFLIYAIVLGILAWSVIKGFLVKFRKFKEARRSKSMASSDSNNSSMMDMNEDSSRSSIESSDKASNMVELISRVNTLQTSNT